MLREPKAWFLPERPGVLFEVPGGQTKKLEDEPDITLFERSRMACASITLA